VPDKALTSLHRRHAVPPRTRNRCIYDDAPMRAARFEVSTLANNGTPIAYTQVGSVIDVEPVTVVDRTLELTTEAETALSTLLSLNRRRVNVGPAPPFNLL